MKSKVGFSSNSIRIQTPITFLFIYSVFGALMGGTGIYNLGEIYPFDHILIGFGIIFLFSGLFSLLNTKYYKILVNEDPGYLSLVESTGWDISPLKIPYKYFTEIVIQYIVNRNKPEYGILLKNRMGALLLITKFHNEKLAAGFKANFEKTIGLPVKENREIPYDMIDSKHPYNPYGIVLPNNSSIRIIERRDSQDLTWKTKYHPLQIAFMFVVYYGFFHIINFAVVPVAQFNVAVAIVIYTALGVILSFLVTAVISNYFGTHYVIIKKESIIHYDKILGRKLHENEMKKSDISLIRSSIEFSNEDLVIVSRKGIEGVNNLIKKSSRKKEGNKVADVNDKHLFKEEIIKLNESNLKLAEKLYIEQFILKNI
ncbi:MAG TPA: hypothetical protein PKG60_10755 [Spirochaetota bacterium]|nr:hypothetical protein [Spirochaetota bacterium]